MLAAGGKRDRAAALMRRLADERSRVSVHGLTGISYNFGELHRGLGGIEPSDEMQGQ